MRVSHVRDFLEVNTKIIKRKKEIKERNGDLKKNSCSLYIPPNAFLYYGTKQKYAINA